MRIALAGLSLSGKTTLFDALSHHVIDSATHPSRADHPNVASVRILDSRVDFFPDDVWDAYIRIGTVRSDWRELLDKYDVEMIVWNRQLSEELPTALQSSLEWNSVYEDDLAAVFVRSGARDDATQAP